MAESSLTIRTADLKRAYGLYTGYGRDPADWDDVTADETEDFNQALEAALRAVYFPARVNGRTHRWTFMYPTAVVTTNGPYSTGTIGIVSGVVTLSVAGTFPSWAASGQLKVSGNTYTIDTRDGDNQVTLDDTTVDVDAGTSYQLIQAYYDLPDDFLDFDSPLTYQPGVSSYYPAIEFVDEQMIRVYQQSHEYVNRPVWAAVVPTVLDPTAGQRWQLLFCPTPDASYRLSFRYLRCPNTLDDTNIYHAGGAPFSELIKLSLLAKAEEQINDGSTQMYQRFQQALEGAIDYDNQQNLPACLGYNGDGAYVEGLPSKYQRQEIAYYSDINYIPL